MIELKHYRFWVQSVLPLVYDDSLSYYEVLAKCVDYINNLIDNDNEMLASIEEMQGAIEELRQMIEDAGITDVEELKERVSTLEGKTETLEDKTETLETKTEDLPNYETNNPVMDGTASAGSSTKYSRGDHVHPTDTSRASTESVESIRNMVTNRNLLDNWYFVGGGSQLGDGVLPINQRGQTSWPGGDGASVDRWLNTNGSLELTADGLFWAAGANNFYFAQRIYHPSFGGKQVTATILYADGSLDSGTAIAPIAGGESVNGVINNAKIRCYFINSSTGIFTFGLNIKQSLTIQAIKLELGSTQTLAHQENNVWTLNELPNFGIELANCQRYYLRITNASASIPVASGYNASANSTSPVFYLPLPVTMAGVPTASISGSVYVYPPNSTPIEVTAVGGCYLVSSGVAIAVAIATGGPGGGGYILRPSTGSMIELTVS